MSGDERSGEDGNDLRFRIFFRGFLLLCLIAATSAVFDDKAPTIHRMIGGLLWLALAFVFFAVGRPIGGRLYASAIAVFCLLLGGFGTVGCLLDEKCVPLELGLAAVAATALMLCARWLDLHLPQGTVGQLLMRCATIAGLTVAFYVAYGYRAFGGGLMFLAFAFIAFASLFEKEDQAERVEPPKPRPVQPHSPIVLAAASAAYWLAGYSRNPLGAWLIAGGGAAWLLYTVYRFWQARPAVRSAPQ